MPEADAAPAAPALDETPPEYEQLSPAERTVEPPAEDPVEVAGAGAETTPAEEAEGARS